MSKKPTPKKRLSKDRGRRRHSVFANLEVVRLRNFAASPFSRPAEGRSKSGKALKKITKVRA